jgi:flagellar basal body-associated protein FliL
LVLRRPLAQPDNPREGGKSQPGEEMAEEKDVKKDAEPKKGKKAKGGKKGKLPVLIVLVAVLGGGGFFGMKMAGGKKHVETPVLAEGDETHVVSLGEYMVNTNDGEAFLKATVFVHLADKTSLFGAGGHGEAAGVEVMAPYVDAVREVLASQKRGDLQSVGGESKIKVKIAEVVNNLYRQRNPEEAKKLPKLKKGEVHEDWQSTDGPVLMVYLTDYVWE